MWGSKKTALRLEWDDPENPTTVTLWEEQTLLFQMSRDSFETVAASAQKWFNFVNFTIGTAGLAFAQTAQGTPHPPLNATVGLVWLSMLYLYLQRSHFPEYLRLLRANPNSNIRKLRAQLESVVLGSTRNILVRACFFFVGYLYLLLIVFLWLPAVQDFKVPYLEDVTLSQVLLPSSCACIPKAPQPAASSVPGAAVPSLPAQSAAHGA